MAKKSSSISDQLPVDRVLTVAVLSAATSYIVRGTWAGVFFEAAAIVLGVIWAARAMITNPAREFRLLAALILVLLTSLLAFYLGAAKGLL